MGTWVIQDGYSSHRAFPSKHLWNYKHIHLTKEKVSVREIGWLGQSTELVQSGTGFLRLWDSKPHSLPQCSHISPLSVSSAVHATCLAQSHFQRNLLHLDPCWQGKPGPSLSGFYWMDSSSQRTTKEASPQAGQQPIRWPDRRVLTQRRWPESTSS